MTVREREGSRRIAVSRLMRPVSAVSVILLAGAALTALGAPGGPAAARETDPWTAAETLAQQQDPVAAGEQLYEASCASCHGTDAGGTQYGPSLIGVGAASLDFQLRTGRMPFTQEPGEQTVRKPPVFDSEEISQIIAYVQSFSQEGPPIPDVTLDPELLPRGQALFAANCAPCHGATGHGGAIGGGAIAPGLSVAGPLDVAEAVVTGPGQMPAFAFDEEDRNAVVTYTDHLRTAPSPGGLSIGGIGPVPEGFVAWTLGMGALLVVVVLVGREWTPPRRAQDTRHEESP